MQENPGRTPVDPATIFGDDRPVWLEVGFGGGEPKLMEAGGEVVVTDLPAPADGLRIGLSTCYDLRFPELYRAQLDRGAEVFVIPSAWPMARVEHWRLLLRARAVEDQCFVVAANTAGTHAGVEMGGHSAVVDPSGSVLAEAGPGEETLSVEIDAAPQRIDLGHGKSRIAAASTSATISAARRPGFSMTAKNT